MEFRKWRRFVPIRNCFFGKWLAHPRIRGKCAYGCVQSSMRRPGTRENSPVLFVTKVAP